MHILRRWFLVLGQSRSLPRILCLILSAIFLTAGLGKLLQGNKLLALADYQFLPGSLNSLVSLLLPWAEIALGILLISGYFRRVVTAISILCILTFVGTNIYSLVNNSLTQCNCFGGILPLNHWQSLTIDLVMLFITFILWRYRDAGNKIRRKTVNVKVLRVISACLMVITVITTFLPVYVHAADLPQNSSQHPLMHPTQEQLDQWEADYVNGIVPTGNRALVESETENPPSYTLLQDISYVPAERNQGAAGNCWVWAGTGLMEVSLNIDKSLSDRLSIQYFDSNYNNGAANSWAGCGGDLPTFASFYQGTQKIIPWSNNNASYQDGNQDCSAGSRVLKTSIVTTPYYPVSSSIAAVSIPTTGVGSATAIANIKSYLLAGKAIYFGFYLTSAGWSAFDSFWDSDSENTVIDLDNDSGGSSGGGHGVVCVGYDDTGATPCWIMLNSWGTNAGRPDDLFRVPQDLNYDSTFAIPPSTITYYCYKFQVLNNTYDTSWPSVITEAASNIGSTTATVNCNVTQLSSAPANTVAFQWGTSSGTYTHTTTAITVPSTGEYSTNLTSLSPLTTYYYRAAATGSTPFYGAEKSFTTNNTRTITASAGVHGSIAPSGTVTVNYGDSQTFIITSNTGYHVATLTVDSIAVPLATSYTFTHVIANHTIVVTFDPNPVQVAFKTSSQTITAGSASGVITIEPRDGTNSSTSVAGDTTVSLSSTSSTGTFDISSSGSFDGSITSITIPAGSKSANFYYKDTTATAPGTTTIKIDASSSGLGVATQTETINPAVLHSITISPANPSVVVGNTQSFTAQGYDTYNNPISGLTYNWSVTNPTAGIINSSGLFTAGTVSDTYNQVIQASVSPITGSTGVVLLPDSIDHYAVSSITSPQGIGIPFSVIVQAQDQYNNNITTGGETMNLTFGLDDVGATPTSAVTSNGAVTIGNMTMMVKQNGQSIKFTGADSGKSGTSNSFDVVVQHRITASAGDNGQISPVGTVIVNDPNDQAFTITPNTGYHVADVLKDRVSVGAVITYTFTHVVADHTISTSFAIDTFTLTPSVVGAHGSIAPSDVVTVNYGDSQTFTFTPDSGYHVATLTVDGAPAPLAASYTFTNVTDNHTIAVTFDPDPTQIKFTTSSQTITAGSASGVITIEPRDETGTRTSVVADTTVSLSSTSTAGKFDTSASGSFSLISIVIPTGSTSANFYYRDTKAGTPTITIASSLPEGGDTQPETINPADLHSITVSPANPSVVVGTTRSFTAQGYDTYNNPISGLSYNWSVTNSTAGSIDSGSGVFTAGTTKGTYSQVIQASVTPIIGSTGVVLTPGGIDHYIVSNISSPQGTGIPFSITVQAQDQYNNNITTGGETLSLTFGQADTGATPTSVTTSNGRVTINNMTMTVAQTGQSITFTGAPSGKTSTSNLFDVTLLHRITASAGASGHISPVGTVIVSDGSSQAFTITPNTGYHVVDVLVDGASAGAVSTYTFTNVVADHTIAASFSGQPVVASQAATNITTSGATLNGSLSDKGNTSGTVTVSFEYGTTTGYGSTVSGTPATLTAPGIFAANLTNLTPDTTYHFRAKATGNGNANGNDMTFTTNSNNSAGGGSIGGGGGGGGPIGPTSVAGVTNITSIVNSKGVFSQSVYVWSDDNKILLAFGAGTIGLTSSGTPLSQISLIHQATPPPLPAGANIIGLTYDFTPSGATFDPPVTIRFNYDPALVPAGVAESSLQIAYFDSTIDAWVTLPCTVDTVNHFIFAQISHFTPYAVTHGVPAVTPVPTTTTVTTTTPTTTAVMTTTPATTTVTTKTTSTTPVTTTTPTTSTTVVTSTPTTITLSTTTPTTTTLGGVKSYVVVIIVVAFVAAIGLLVLLMIRNRQKP